MSEKKLTVQEEIDLATEAINALVDTFIQKKVGRLIALYATEKWVEYIKSAKLVDVEIYRGLKIALDSKLGVAANWRKPTDG